MRQCGPKNYFWVASWRGSKENGFTQILFNLLKFLFMLFLDFLQVENLKFEFWPKVRLNGHRKKKYDAHLQIDQKDRFSNNKNLNFNFNRENGFIDPRSISQDINMVLKGFELSLIWGKRLFLRPPFSPHREIVFFFLFWPALSHFLPISLRKVSNHSGRHTASNKTCT